MKYLILIFVLFSSILQRCNCHETKEESVLKKIAKDYINKHEQKLADNEKDRILDCNTPVYVEIYQEEHYMANKMYTITNSDMGIRQNELPSKIFKYKDRYVVLYLKDTQPMLLKYVPKILHHSCGPTYTDDEQWTVMMCPDSHKYIVLDLPPMPYDMMKEFQTFECK